MGAIAIPVLAVREEIILEIDDEQPTLEENGFKDHDREEPEKLHPEENQITVEESGATVRPVIALRAEDVYD